jgi:hypothetical protein
MNTQAILALPVGLRLKAEPLVARCRGRAWPGRPPAGHRIAFPWKIPTLTGNTFR